MSLNTYDDVEQGSDEWLALRRGMVTASTVGQLLEVATLGALAFNCDRCGALPDKPCVSVAKGGAAGDLKNVHPERTKAATEAAVTEIRPAPTDDSKRLVLLLVSERITGESDYREQYLSNDMLAGQLDEPLAREVYAEHFAKGEPVTTTGFLVNDDHGFDIGASPDGLVGDYGGLEIKCPRAKEHVRTILADEVPPRYMAQIQACLLVTGREWWDYMSFYGGLRPYVKRVRPDAKWQSAIVDAVAAFEQQAEEMVHDYHERTVGMPDTEPRIDLSDIQVA